MPFRSSRMVVRPLPETIEELSGVRLLTTVGADLERVVPAGSSGTVVFVHGEGEAFEVEFIEPFQALVTATRDQIEPIPGEERAAAADALLDRAR